MATGTDKLQLICYIEVLYIYRSCSSQACMHFQHACSWKCMHALRARARPCNGLVRQHCLAGQRKTCSLPPPFAPCLLGPSLHVPQLPQSEGGSLACPASNGSKPGLAIHAFGAARCCWLTCTTKPAAKSSMAKPPPALVGTPPTLAAAATPAMQPWHPLNFRNQARVWEAEQVNCCPAAGPPHARHAPRALPLSTLIAVCGVAQTPAVRALPDRRIMTVRRRRRRPR